MSEKSVNVILRLRPPLRKDERDDLFEVDKTSILDKTSAIRYQFNAVYDKDCSTDEIHDECVQPIVDAALKGFHGTIFAYGQTGSGKTHTMNGNRGNPGIIRQMIQLVFQRISQDMTARQYLLRMSYLEIYCEKITDLLWEEAGADRGRSKGGLEVRDDPHTGIPFIQDLREEVVTCVGDVMRWLELGESRRRTGSTAMNERSSRSHAIFRLIIESKDGDGAVTMSHLNMIDLAGSEKVHQTKAEGQTMKEGIEINLSLSSLARVIKQVTEQRPGTHVSYRDSKLTRILQNAIGGNSSTLILCAIAPGDREESLSTIRFATTAKSVKNKPSKNEILTEAAMMKRMQHEIAELKEKCAKLQAEKGTAEELEERRRLLQAINEKFLSGTAASQTREIKRKNRAAAELRRYTCAPSFAAPSLSSPGGGGDSTDGGDLSGGLFGRHQLHVSTLADGDSDDESQLTHHRRVAFADPPPPPLSPPPPHEVQSWADVCCQTETPPPPPPPPPASTTTGHDDRVDRASSPLPADCGASGNSQRRDVAISPVVRELAHCATSPLRGATVRQHVDSGTSPCQLDLVSRRGCSPPAAAAAAAVALVSDAQTSPLDAAAAFQSPPPPPPPPVPVPSTSALYARSRELETCVGELEARLLAELGAANGGEEDSCWARRVQDIIGDYRFSLIEQLVGGQAEEDVFAAGDSGSSGRRRLCSSSPDLSRHAVSRTRPPRLTPHPVHRSRPKQSLAQQLGFNDSDLSFRLDDSCLDSTALLPNAALNCVSFLRALPSPPSAEQPSFLLNEDPTPAAAARQSGGRSDSDQAALGICQLTATLQSLEQQLAERDATIQNLQSQLQSSATEPLPAQLLDGMQGQMQALLDKELEVQSLAERHSCEMEALQQQMKRKDSVHREEKASMKAELDAALARESELQQQHDAKLREEETAKQVEVLQAELVELRAENESLRRANGEEWRGVVTELEEVKCQLRACGEEKDGLSGELEDAQLLVAEFRAHGDHLEDQVRQLERQVQQLEGQVQQAESQVQQAEGQVEQLEGQVRAKEDQVRAKEDQVQNLEGQVQQLEGQVQQAESQMQLAGGQIEQLEGQVRAKEDQVQNLEGQVQQLEDQLQQAESQVRAKEDQVQQAEGQVDQLEGQVRAKEEQVQNLEGQIQNLEGQVHNLEGQVQQLEGQVQQAEGQVQNLESQVQLEGQVQQLEGQVQQLEGQVRAKESQVQNLEGQVQNLKAQVQQAESQVQQAESQVQQAEGQVRAKEDQVQQLEGQVQQLEGQVRAKEEGLAVAEQQSTRLENELGGKDVQLESLQVELQTFKTQLEALQVQLDQSQIEAESYRQELHNSLLLIAPDSDVTRATQLRLAREETQAAQARVAELEVEVEQLQMLWKEAAAAAACESLPGVHETGECRVKLEEESGVSRQCPETAAAADDSGAPTDVKQQPHDSGDSDQGQLTNYQALLKHAHATISELSQKLDTLERRSDCAEKCWRSESEEANGRIEQLNCAIQCLEVQLAEAKAAEKESSSHKGELEGALAALKEEMEANMRRLVEEKEIVQSEVDRLAEENGRLQEVAREHEDIALECQSLRMEVQSLRTSIAASEAALKEATRGREELQLQLASALEDKRVAAAAESELECLRHQLAELTEREARTAKALEEEQFYYRKLEAEYEAVNAQLLALMTHSTTGGGGGSCWQDVTVAPVESTDLQPAAQLQSQLEDKSRQLALLQSQLEDKSRQLALIQSQLEDKSRELAETKEELETKCDDHEFFAKLAYENEQLLQFKDEAINLEGELKEARDKMVELERELEERRETESARFALATEAYQKRVVAMRNEKSELEMQLKRANARVKDLESALADAERRAFNQEDKWRSMNGPEKFDLVGWRKEAEMYKRNYLEKKGQLARVFSDVREKEEEIRGLKKKMHQLYVENCHKQDCSVLDLDQMVDDNDLLGLGGGGVEALRPSSEHDPNLARPPCAASNSVSARRAVRAASGASTRLHNASSEERLVVSSAEPAATRPALSRKSAAAAAAAAGHNSTAAPTSAISHRSAVTKSSLLPPLPYDQSPSMPNRLAERSNKENNLSGRS